MVQKDSRIKQQEKSKKEAKKITRSRPSAGRAKLFRLSSIRSFFTETVGELRKVSWPTRKEALYLTGVVLVVMGIMSLLLGVILDFLFSRFFALIFA